jgi:hypothetical protein
MKTTCKTEGTVTSSIFTEVEPEYQDTVRGLYYLPGEHGFAKSFPSDTPNLDGIYRNFERYAEEMVLQGARLQPVQWEKTLSAFLQIIQGATIHWWLVGSAALAVRGLDVAPRDIDLVVDDVGAYQLAELLQAYLVEPLQITPGWIWNSFGRAFLFGRLEWVGGVNEGADSPAVADFGPAAGRRLEVVKWRGAEILVPPLDLQLEVSRRRGLVERAAKIDDFMLNRD